MLTKEFTQSVTLYRCDFGQPPEEWSNEYKSPIYVFDEEPKNAGGFYFFFNDKQETLAVGRNVISIKKDYLESISQCELWLTEVHTQGTIRMLDLSMAKDVIDLYIKIWRERIDIFTNDFYRIAPCLVSKPLSDIREQVINLAEEKYLTSDKKNEYKCDIWNFAYGFDDSEKLKYALQQLSDFDNGIVFRGILESKGFDGYIFKETDAETFAFVSPSKLGKPIHFKSR